MRETRDHEDAHASTKPPLGRAGNGRDAAYDASCSFELQFMLVQHCSPRCADNADLRQ
jgi:hypothetical protein